MKKFDVSPSKVLLILLGVLVAIIIGFSSSAIGANNSFVDLQTSAKTKFEKTKHHISQEAPKKLKIFLMQLID